MAKWQTRDLDSKRQVEPDDEFIELSALDFDDLPPTDPMGTRPRLAPPQPQQTDLAQLRQFLRTPVCVEFEDDRVSDLTPPPVVGGSIAPTSASLPPQDFKRDMARSSPARWSLPLLALSAGIALGIIAFRVADKNAAFAPSTPMAAMAQPTADIPSFSPEDFPVLEETAEGEIEYEWIDLTNAPREDWPPSGSPPATDPSAVSEKTEGADKVEAPIRDTVAEEIAPDEDNAEPPKIARAFDRDEASASLSAVAGGAVACRGDAPSGFAKVAVTFAPSGRVTTAVVDGPFAGTPTGGCIARTFRGARVHPFDGSLVTVRKTVILK
jgi:hypothetical protein